MPLDCIEMTLTGKERGMARAPFSQLTQKINPCYPWKMRYLPINIDVRDKYCTVVGGGPVALRKVRYLLDAGARVKLVSPDVTAGFKDLLSNGSVFWLQRKYQYGDIEGSFIAFIATGSPDEQGEAIREARELNIPVNVADEPLECAFTFPSVVERGDLLITISTGGKCPALSRRLRLQFEEIIDQAYEGLLEILADARGKLLAAGVPSKNYAALLESLISSEILDTIRKGKEEEAKAFARGIVSTAITGKSFMATEGADS